MTLESDLAAQEARLERARARFNGMSNDEPLVCAANVVERPLEPLWPGVMFIGKPTLLAGDPGTGKSLVTIDIAARVSRGEPWPCSTERQTPGDVVILSAEDDPSDVTNGRLRAAGADVSRVHYLNSFRRVDTATGTRRRSVQFDQDVEWVKEHICKMERSPRLLIVDPLSAYMGASDSHNNAETRAVLAQLAELAAGVRMAVLVVSHLNKGESGNALYRVSGSLAFVAAARAVYLIEQDPKTEGRILMLAVKSNYGPTTRNFAYSKSEADNGHGYVKWEDEPVKFSADMLLGSRKSPRELAKEAAVDSARAWLHAELIDGPRLAREIEAAAKVADISERALREATKVMRIVKTQDGFHGPWSWALPAHSYTSVPCPK